jgi:hypothetical protein
MYFPDLIDALVGDVPVDAAPSAIALRPTSTAIRAGVEQTTSEKHRMYGKGLTNM